MSILIGLLSVVYVFLAFSIMFVVLIQRGEGGGLGGAFGGGAVDVAFGAKADLTWKKATGVVTALFVMLTVVLGTLARFQYESSVLAVRNESSAVQQDSAADSVVVGGDAAADAGDAAADAGDAAAGDAAADANDTDAAAGDADASEGTAAPPADKPAGEADQGS